MRKIVCTLTAVGCLVGLMAIEGAAQEPGDIVPGRYVVMFRAEVANPAAAAQQLSRLHGFGLRHIYRFALRGMVIDVPAGKELGVLSGLRHDPRVLAVGHDRYVGLFAQTVSKDADRINAEPGIAPNTGAGIQVAVIDTGIDLVHADLAGNVNAALSVSCIGGAGCSPGGQDDNGHGTAVSGIIGAANNTLDLVGVAPQVELIAVKVLDAAGSGTFGDVTAGVDYITGLNQGGNPIEVANMSLGAFCPDCTEDSTDPVFVAFHAAIQNLVNSGTTLVVAAGNSSGDSASAVPAAYDEVITVSAMSESDGLPGGQGPDQCLFWFFDCLDPIGDDEFALTAIIGFSNFGADVDVVAPGVGVPILQLGGGIVLCNEINLTSCSGTSFSSPHVAGVAAIFVKDQLDKNGVPPLPSTVREALIQTGECYEFGTSAGGLFHGTTGCPQVWPNDPDGIAEPLVRADNVVNYASSGAVDRGVTSISLMSAPATTDGVEVISVGVENRSSQEDTITVTLTDDADVTYNPSQIVVVAAMGLVTVDFDWTPNAAGDHPLTATVTGGGTDSNPDNDQKQLMVAVVVPTRDVAVTSVTAPALAAAGDVVSEISVVVTNEGTFDEEVSVSLQPSPAAAAGTSTSSQPAILAPGESANFTFSWDTTGTSAQDYTLTATASIGSATGFAPGTDNDSADNTGSDIVSILMPKHDAAVTAIISADSVLQGTALGFFVDVANSGTFSEDVEVELIDTPPNGGTAGTWSGVPNPQTISLDGITTEGGTSTAQVLFIWETAGASGGPHTLTARVTLVQDDDASNDTMEKTVTVESEETNLVIVSVTPPATVIEGDQVQVPVVVENQSLGGTPTLSGFVQLDNFTSDPDGITPVTQPFSLAPGESVTLAFTWDTSTAVAGDNTLSAIFNPVAPDTNLAGNSKQAISKVLLAAPTNLTATTSGGGGGNGNGNGNGKGGGPKKAAPSDPPAILLAWVDNSNNETSYLIDRCEVITSGKGRDKTTTCVWVNSYGSAAADSTSYSDTGVTSGTKYRYRVKAANGDPALDSGYSNEIEVKAP